MPENSSLLLNNDVINSFLNSNKWQQLSEIPLFLNKCKKNNVLLNLNSVEKTILLIFCCKQH